LQNPHILNKYKEAEAKCRQLVHEYEAVAESKIINSNNVAFSALTLLVGRQEEHLACKN